MPNGDQDIEGKRKGPASAPPSEDGKSLQEAPPRGYLPRKFDWYEEGKVFSVWAPLEPEIHDKKFILLKSHNNEGMGVLVRSLETEEKEQFESSSGIYRTHMALSKAKPHIHEKRGTVDRSKEIQPGEYETIYLDIYSGREVEPDTFVFLKHMYNISFQKYACKDLGIIRSQCLHKLRVHFVRHLIDLWGLGEEMRDAYA